MTDPIHAEFHNADGSLNLDAIETHARELRALWLKDALHKFAAHFKIGMPRHVVYDVA